MASEQEPNALEKPQTAFQAPIGESNDAIRRAEAALANAEDLVETAVNPEEELDDAAWQLTLTQWTLGRKDFPERQWTRQGAMLIASATMVVYLIYRLLWTLNWSSVGAAAFSIVLYTAECYAGFSLLLYFYQVWQLVEPPLRRPTGRRTVDVYVATYNEDVSLLRGTLNACIQMDYPHATYVLDDGAREEVRQLAQGLGVRYISRTDRRNAKAGNLNNALRQTDGEFVIVLDADHIPYRHFISRLIGYFDDPRMGFVQVPHTTYNLDNFMGRWKSSSKAYWEDVRIFFEAVQLGKNRHGVACFCGSAAMFRRQAIEDVGLFATETITEDMHTGMRIHAAGWKSLALSEEMVVGLAPDDAATFASQRLRWGEGNLSVMAYDNPLTMKGLTLPGRINYLASIASWTMGPARLILYLTPLIMLLSGVAPVSDMSVAYFTAVGCYLVTVWAAVKIASNGCGQLLGIEMAMMASFPLQLQAIWRALFRRGRQKFVVTPKQPSTRPMLACLWKMWPLTSLIAISIIAVTWAICRTAFGLSEDYVGLLIGSGLATYHAWLASTVLSRASLKRDPIGQWRHPLCLHVDYSIAGEDKPGISIELNENVCRLLTREKLETGWPLRVVFNSPIGETVCHGHVTDSITLANQEVQVCLSNVEFEHATEAKRTQESDLLRNIIVQYIVPVVTMTHRLVHQGERSLPEELSGEGDFPIPITLDTNQANLPIQKAVALGVNQQRFLAATGTPFPIHSTVHVLMQTPLGDISTEAEVADVETMRVGTAIIHQHEFLWRDASAAQKVERQTRRWKSILDRGMIHLRYHRRSPTATFGLLSAACLLSVLTVFLFQEIRATDIFLTASVRHAVKPDERAKIEDKLNQQVILSRTPKGRLLRIYEAATAIGDHQQAANAAAALADKVPADRFDWLLTRARQLAQTDMHQETAAAFDQLLEDPAERKKTLDEQADIYVDAARAAVAVGDYDKAVERFLSASNLKTTDPEQAEELLGVLISAQKTQLAILVLQQLEKTDRVLEQIVNVHEMAQEAEKALPELMELHRRHPEDAHFVRRLAELAVVRRDFAEAVNYYKMLQQLEPENNLAKEKLAESIVLLARKDVEEGRTEKAIREFDESFQLIPPSDPLKREYAGCLASAGRFAQAAAILEPMHDPDSRQQLASSLEMEGETRKALRILLELRDSGRDNRAMQRSIARLLLANHEYEAAADQFAALLRDEPENPQLQRAFLDAVASSPQGNEPTRLALIGLNRLYEENGYASLDEPCFERLSESLRQRGMFEESRRCLDKGVAEFPKNRRLRFYLAQTLTNLGLYNDAESQYEILLRK